MSQIPYDARRVIAAIPEARRGPTDSVSTPPPVGTRWLEANRQAKPRESRPKAAGIAPSNCQGGASRALAAIR